MMLRNVVTSFGATGIDKGIQGIETVGPVLNENRFLIPISNYEAVGVSAEYRKLIYTKIIESKLI